jgi:argininosuccinate lyase
MTAHIVLNIILVIGSTSAILYLAISGSRHSKKQDEIKRRFLEEEDEANRVRKKEIDPDLFYTADLSALPEIPESDPHQIIRCAKRKMIHFTEPISNLELKKKYGQTQMDIIAQYEENFSEFLKSLTKWAESLMEENQSDALLILETVVAHGGEFRDAYKLSADIYVEKNDKSGMDALLAQTEKNHFKDPSIRRQILEYINLKKEEFSS